MSHDAGGGFVRRQGYSNRSTRRADADSAPTAAEPNDWPHSCTRALAGILGRVGSTSGKLAQRLSVAHCAMRWRAILSTSSCIELLTAISALALIPVV